MDLKWKIQLFVKTKKFHHSTLGGNPPPAKPLKGGVQNHSPALPVGEAMLNTCVCHLYWIILYADQNCWDNRITRGQTIGS